MDRKPTVSVIIPTYNRAASLRETLESLAQQSYPADRFEVIVVDDGSTDDTQEMLATFKPPYTLYVIMQKNRGAAAARNLGVRYARGEILLFLDADIIADSELLIEHVHSHSRDSHLLVAGLRLPWPKARVSPAIRLLEADAGRKENFPQFAPYLKVLTANLSVGRACFEEIGGFDAEFPPGTGFEDMDFAYRAWKHGLRIVWNSQAIGYHNHPISFTQMCRQTECYHVSAPLLLKKHPELAMRIEHFQDKMPIVWCRDSPSLIARKVARGLLAIMPVLRILQLLVIVLEHCFPSSRVLRFLCWKVLGSYQLIGFRRGIALYGSWSRASADELEDRGSSV